MSGIYIPNMEMPKYCCHCRFESSSIHGQYCILTKKFTRLDDNEDGSERHISCPLVEVPTHGDLVDRQKLIKALSKAWDVDDDQDFANKSVWRIVEKEAPTIIEASTDGTEERE